MLSLLNRFEEVFGRAKYFMNEREEALSDKASSYLTRLKRKVRWRAYALPGELHRSAWQPVSNVYSRLTQKLAGPTGAT